MFETVLSSMSMKISGYFAIGLLISVLIGSCAKVGSPIGGPKDVTPPKVKSSKPQNNATNFKSDKVEIEFNEFLKFKDKDKNFVTSPPFKKKPEVILKYKTVVVNFREDLLPDRTYTLNFGNSITDNNEGNPIRDFEFVFSTGSYIDSLSFEGKVENAFNHQPDKDGLFVMLYDVFGDSVPMKTLPAYTSKTNEKGFFRINHIKADTFMVVAIKDANNDFMYQSTEEVAFSDSLLFLNTSFYHAPDTAAARDTATSDSAYYSRFKPQMTLYTFVNESKKQFLSVKDRKKANNLTYVFNVPVDTFKIGLVGETRAKPWYLLEESANKDTFSLWITDTTLVRKDTLQTVLTYAMPDSMNVLRPKLDTLKMVYKAPKEQPRRGRTKENSIERIIINTDARDGFDLNSILHAEADVPIEHIDLKKVYFTYTEDSVYKPVKFTLRRDTINYRKFNVDFVPVPAATYSLVFDSLAIKSLYNTYNDSTGYKFTAQKDDYYGAIKATLSNVKGNIILQVLNEKENVVKTTILKEDKLVNLDYLAPGKYLLKVIHDTNGTGRWDTGNLIKRQQPEKVEYYKDPVSVRSNWDVEVSWRLE